GRNPAETPDTEVWVGVGWPIGKLLQSGFADSCSHWNSSCANGLLDRFGLDSNLRVDELSEGQLACLEVLLELAQEPRVVLVDATSADTAETREIMARGVVQALSSRSAAVVAGYFYCATLD